MNNPVSSDLVSFLDTLDDSSDYDSDLERRLQVQVKSKALRFRSCDSNHLLVAGMILLIFVFLVVFQDFILPIQSTESTEEKIGDFCIWNHLAPSILGVGVQKCGTTTIDRILDQFHDISHGKEKEHHYFDQSDPKLLDTPSKYWKNFPRCDGNKRSKYTRTYEYTGNYSNPDNNSPQNIRAFYDNLGLPTEKIIFLIMLCNPKKRMESAWYFQKYKYKIYKDNPAMKNFNSWARFMISDENDRDPGSIFKRGFFDIIMERWLEFFPKNKFIIMNSYHTFGHVQEITDILSDVSGLNPVKLELPLKHINRGKTEKEPMEDDVSKILDDFYANHTRRLTHILTQASKLENVILFPPIEKFFDGLLPKK